MDYEMMWVEKYRPKTLDEIIGHDENKIRLKGFIKNKSLPHLLFAGPPGTGKTSAVLALASEIFGKKSLRNNLLELNASDERGIDVVRNQIKRRYREAIRQVRTVLDRPVKVGFIPNTNSVTSSFQQVYGEIQSTFEKISRSL